jgi:hypothetical protein
MAEGVQTVSLKPRAAEKQSQLYYKDGSPIAPADVAGAVSRGDAFSSGDDVRVSVDGGGAAVPTSGLANFIAQRGASVETDSEGKRRALERDAGSLGGMAKTAGESFIREGTAGFLGPEQFYDEAGRERAMARIRANPKTAVGFGLAGALGATLAASALTGGAAAGGAGARLAQLAARGALTPFRAAAAAGEAAEALTGASTLGRIAGLSARGVAEGAMFGVGHEVSQAALEDVPLTAERLLAGAWDGAKMGGAFGLGLGVLGQGVGKAGRAIVGRMAETGDDLGKATGTWAERAMFKQQVGNQGKFFDKATRFGADEAGPARIGRKLLDANMSTEAGAALRQADDLAKGAANRLKAVAEAADVAGARPDVSTLIGRVDDQISKLRETPFGDFQAIADRVEKQIAPFRARVEANAARNSAEPIRTRLADGTIELRPRAPAEPIKFSELWDLRKKLDETISWESKQQGAAKEALTDMRDAFRAELDDTLSRAADGGSPELLAAWKKAAEDYGDFALVKDGLKGLIKQRGKNRGVSLTDYGTGGAAGVLMGILSGSPITGMAVSAATSAAHKLIRERGAGVLAKIADRTGGVAGRMEMAGKVAALVEAPKRLAAPAAVNVSNAFDTYSAALTQAQTEPAKFAERMAGATADLSLRAPELAQQVQQTMLGDMAYLNQLHPQPASRKNSTITPLAKLPEFYAFNQKKAFVDAAIAIDNPVSIFEDIARGELPLEGIKALKARRPLLFGEMRTTVIKYTSQRTEELPYSRRVLLGTAFDFPADWSMAHVGEIQESLLASNDPKSKNDPTAAPSKIGTDPGANIQPGNF